MAKSVIVMEMPESCSDCGFSYEFFGTKKCQLLNEHIRQHEYTLCRQDDCHLVELPEKMDGLMAAEMVPDCENPVAFAQGWNALLSVLLGYIKYNN